MRGSYLSWLKYKPLLYYFFFSTIAEKCEGDLAWFFGVASRDALPYPG